MIKMFTPFQVQCAQPQSAWPGGGRHLHGLALQLPQHGGPRDHGKLSLSCHQAVTAVTGGARPRPTQPHSLRPPGRGLRRPHRPQPRSEVAQARGWPHPHQHNLGLLRLDGVGLSQGIIITVVFGG